MNKSFFCLIALAVTCGLYAAENFAANCTVTASSSERAEFGPEKAVDGNAQTRWSSNRGDNEWIMLDLGEMKTVGQIQLVWEAAAGKEYAVQFSADGENFTDVFNMTDGKPNAKEMIRVKPQETRYIRIQGKKRASQYGYSLWEIKVLPASDNLALFSSAKASSMENGGLSPDRAVDGNPKTRWSSKHTDNENITLDLGSEMTVGKIILKWEAAAGKEYLVQLSADGENFTTVFNKTDGEKGHTETIAFEPQQARFIRVQGIKRATPHGYSLWEIEAYAK